MRPAPAFRLLIALCGLLLLGGCAGLEENRRNSDFGLQTLSYENAIRWGEYKLAASYIKPGTLAAPIDFGHYDGIQITDYQVRNTLRDGESRITLELRISYLRKGEVAVRQVDQEQVWEYDEGSKRWWIIGGLPEFR
jgi:hypothetical protein